ncbi:MAG: hypothetical protein U1E78_06155 [Gammaproteobacteria bacterium]
MKTTKLLGASLALAAASLFASSVVVAGEPAGTEAKVPCMGINACKGTSECKTAANACKGQNECKGKGWVNTTSAEECTSKGGTVVNNS